MLILTIFNLNYKYSHSFLSVSSIFNNNFKFKPQNIFRIQEMSEQQSQSVNSEQVP